MPLDRSIQKIVIIGAGPIVIGQACEFDYSGTQACKALKEEGYTVILLNSNPATIMTDSSTADAVYIEPITSDVLEKIFQRERPDALLPTMGGQTGLNCAEELSQKGILQKYNVKLLGISLEAIEKAEDRELFKQAMKSQGLEVPRSFCAAAWEEVHAAVEKLGFPVVIRCSFTLGGQGGGIARNIEELERICEEGFTFSPKLLIEESVQGWKEIELEVIRDRTGKGLVICGMENMDPMGVHTGDSIVIAPIQTVSDEDYQLMKKMAFLMMDGIGMVSGGCNVQFAQEPRSRKILAIEINPRVSRSSALASKATGFPIAKIVTKIAAGYTLDELAAIEPVIDYVVTKMPRFDFEKFPDANQELTTHMKSVGEVMGLGATFKESLLKAISSLDKATAKKINPEEINLSTPHPQQFWYIYLALQNGISIEEIQKKTNYDAWFLKEINELVEEEKAIAKKSLKSVNASELERWKQMGFSDERLGTLLKTKSKQISEKRKKLNLHPVYKRLDSWSGIFPFEIACMFSTYSNACESKPTTKKKILVVGSGPNRIGQGIEFDYCCVHGVKAIRELGYESVMINCNPETVSTDWDTTDRLYFEPLTVEHIREVIRLEKPIGTIIQLGGQTPLNIGRYLHKEGIPILGTCFDSIDITEDRKRFRSFAKKIGIKQPKNCFFSTAQEGWEKAQKIGFPMILRPSYVIGGTAIQTIRNEAEFHAYLHDVPIESVAPILMEEFLEEAMEVEVDAICDGQEVFICGIIEHVEPAGIHSGDSICFLSPYKLPQHFQNAIKEQTIKIGRALNILGLFNVQFAIHKNEVVVLEVNARASRTIPLLSKTTALPLVHIATKCILGQSLKAQGLSGMAQPKCLALKMPVFPFSRLHLTNEQLGPQMKSTGEVLCVGKTFDELFMKARMYASERKNLYTSDLEERLPRPVTAPTLEVYDITRVLNW